MYSYIKGEIVELSEETIVVENNGIGYNIRIPASISGSLDGPGQAVKIYTYTYVREDAMLLYGFLTREDLKIFKLLLGVTGIGPKGALAVLSVMAPDDLCFAVLGDDDKAIAKAPGIGKKTARRLILELKDKLSLEEALHLKRGQETLNVPEVTGKPGVKGEAIQALVALGYSSSEALKALNAISFEEDATVEEILKAALRQMSFI